MTILPVSMLGSAAELGRTIVGICDTHKEVTMRLSILLFLVTICAGCAGQGAGVHTPNKALDERRNVIKQTKSELEEAIKNKDYSKAFQITNSYLVANPHDAEAYATRGNIYYLQKKCPEAITDLNKASSMGSTSITIAGIKAMCLAETGKYKVALKTVNKSLRLKQDATLYNVRAYIYNKKGDYVKALEDCNKSIRLDSSKPNPFKNKGLAYLGIARYEKAIEQFNKAIAISPGYDMAYTGRGDTYLKMGNIENATSDFKKACEYGDKESCSKVK